MHLAIDTTTQYTDAMSTLASGVLLVTSRVAGRPWGMTVTAFTSVSADPPTVLVSLGADTVTALAIGATGTFGVSVLADTQVCVAAYAAAPGASKFLDELVERSERDSESPAVADALAHFDCEVVEAVAAADHVVFVGRVLRVRRRPGGGPLLYHGRDYRALGPTTERNLECLAS